MKLTLVCLCAHHLASAVIEANRQAWTIGFHVALRSVVPFDACDMHGAVHTSETVNL